MPNRSEDWLKQAVRDLEQAVDSRAAGRKARILDNFYIPTRYANGHPEGAPFEHYGPLQSGGAIEYAGEILEFARPEMAKSAGSA